MGRSKHNTQAMWDLALCGRSLRSSVLAKQALPCLQTQWIELQTQWIELIRFQ